MKQLFRLMRDVPRPVLAAAAAVAVLTGVLVGVVVTEDSGDGKRLKVTAGTTTTTSTTAPADVLGGPLTGVSSGPQVADQVPSTTAKPTTSTAPPGRATTGQPTGSLSTITTTAPSTTTTAPSNTTTTTTTVPSDPATVAYPDGPADPLAPNSVYLVRVDDGALHKVAGVDKLFDRAQLSSDGGRFLYAAANDGRDVYSARIDGSDTDTVGTGGIEAPTWSAKGDLAVIDYDDTHDLVLTLASGAVVRIEQEQVGPVSGREWSPDGSRIALIAGYRVWVANADGTGLTAVTPVAKAWHWLRWSPDGTRIAYQDGDHLWVVPADGSAAPLDLAPMNADRSFDWSPDGTKLVLCAPWFASPRLSIGVVPAAGGAFAPLGVQGNEVAWSPDGSTIAYKGYPYVNNSPTLGVVRADGTDKRTLLTAPSGSGASLGLGLEWTPDSTRLLVNTGSPGLGGVEQPF